jgi:hypothetical protein
VLKLSSYTVITDFARAGYLMDTQAGQSLWSNLLFQYSLSAPPTALHMVYGEFLGEDEDEDEEEEEGEDEV